MQRKGNLSFRPFLLKETSQCFSFETEIKLQDGLRKAPKKNVKMIKNKIKRNSNRMAFR